MRAGKNMNKRKRTVLSQGMKEMIIRVRHYFEMEFQNGGPVSSVKRPIDRTAVATGLSRRQVCSVTREIYGFSKDNQEGDQSQPSSSKMKKVRPKRTYNKEICRVFIYAYDRVFPYDSRIQLQQALRKAGLYFGGKAAFYRMLLEFGVPLRCPRPRRKAMGLDTDKPISEYSTGDAEIPNPETADADNTDVVKCDPTVEGEIIESAICLKVNVHGHDNPPAECSHVTKNKE